MTLLRINCFLIATITALGHTSWVHAASATLNLTPPTPTENVFEIGLALNGGSPVTDTSNAAGTMEADFDFVASGPDAVITGLTLTGGALGFDDINFDFGGILNVAGTNIGGETTTPNPPGAVSGGGFDAAEHALLINQGTFDISGPVLPMPVSFDLSTLPFSGAGDGPGSVVLAEVSRVGKQVTYDVDLTLPIDFTDRVLDAMMGDPVTLDVTNMGVLVANGRLTVTLPEPAGAALWLFGALLSWASCGQRAQRRSHER